MGPPEVADIRAVERRAIARARLSDAGIGAVVAQRLGTNSAPGSEQLARPHQRRRALRLARGHARRAGLGRRDRGRGRAAIGQPSARLIVLMPSKHSARSLTTRRIGADKAMTPPPTRRPDSEPAGIDFGGVFERSPLPMLLADDRARASRRTQPPPKRSTSRRTRSAGRRVDELAGRVATSEVRGIAPHRHLIILAIGKPPPRRAAPRRRRPAVGPRAPGAQPRRARAATARRSPRSSSSPPPPCARTSATRSASSTRTRARTRSRSRCATGLLDEEPR